METKYHIEITRKALDNHFSDKALATIIDANVHQDRPAYFFGHDYIHFDGSAFDEGFLYIREQEQIACEQLRLGDYQQSQKAFGRISHSWQDLYSHSNYVHLWLSDHPQCSPDSIEVNDPAIFSHPNLASGKNYGLIEFLSMLPLLSWLITPIMPADSHAKMNLDGPSPDKPFEYAYWAAIKATQTAYERMIESFLAHDLSQNSIIYFKNE